MSPAVRPRHRRLYTCVAAVAAALLLAPVSSAAAGHVSHQSAADTVQSVPYRALAAGLEAPSRAETIAAEAAVARAAAKQQAAADEAARIKAEQEESARLQAEAAQAGRVIHVGYTGKQDVVDMGVGPVLFPLPGNWPPYVAEHDFHGGWERIGTLAPGMPVTMTGLVTGSYTVGEIINVPRGGRTADLVFNVMPKVMLQTCIPGTSMMVVVGLY